MAGMKQAVKPGGLLLLQGYTPKQLEYRTGGPSAVENLYTEALLREIFADWEILLLHEHEDLIDEGRGHAGRSALIDLVVRKSGLSLRSDAVLQPRHLNAPDEISPSSRRALADFLLSYFAAADHKNVCVFDVKADGKEFHSNVS